MTTKTSGSVADTDRESEIANARADVIRRAEAQGVKPFRSLKDFAGDPEITTDFEVDEFLRQVREGRDQPQLRKTE